MDDGISWVKNTTKRSSSGSSQKKVLADEEIVPMEPYGIAVSMAWYLATIAAFVYIIVSLFEAGVPGSDVPFIILTD